MPSVPPAQMMPAANEWLYRTFSMAGKARRPISVTTAPTMPVAVANRPQVMSAATPMEPGRFFEATLRVLNSRSTMLARSTIYPMNRKSGMAVRTSLAMTE